MLGLFACFWIGTILCYHANGYATTLGNYALHFPHNGVSDYTNIWGMPSLSQFTVCYWMQSKASNDGTVLSYAVTGQHNELLFFDHANVDMYIAGEGRSLGISSINDGKWHHICASWSNSDGAWKGYKDGQQSKSGTGFKKGYAIKGGGSLVLGQEQDAVGSSFDSKQSFQGSLAQVNLWSEVLSSAKIEEMSKTCNHDWAYGNVYTWVDFLHGIRGGPRIVIPSPCAPP